MLRRANKIGPAFGGLRNAEVRSSILLPSTNFSPRIIADRNRVGDCVYGPSGRSVQDSSARPEGKSAGTASNVLSFGDYTVDTGS